MPCADLGLAGVSPAPQWIEHGEPGGVICTPLHASEATRRREIAIQPLLQIAVEALRSLHVRCGIHDDLELQITSSAHMGLR